VAWRRTQQPTWISFILFGVNAVRDGGSRSRDHFFCAYESRVVVEGRQHVVGEKMLSDLGALYKEEIESRMAAVRTRLGEKGVEEELKAISQTISLLESEGRKNRSATRKEELLNSAAALKREVEALNEDNKRKTLLSHSAKVVDEEAGGLLEDEEALNHSGDALQKSKKNLREMMDIGLGVQENLDRQMDTINSTKGKMTETNNLTARARQALRNIEGNERRQKLFMYCAVLLVVVGVSAAVYMILF
jgi:hypothetical protein